MYLVTVNYRGALHIDPMRLYSDFDKALKYGKTLTGGTLRIYEVFDNKPPKLVKLPK